MIETPYPHHSARALSAWLFICCATIFLMIVVGAITRLTESGLSMVEWRALMDMLPPLSEAEWARVFAKYQTSPEYQKINHGMSLVAFKQIYFWEWLHRLLGRLIGLLYALPLAWFWLQGDIPARLKPRFLLLLGLGALQGFFGWYMVKSGLVNEPRVSHYRLALHLGTALLIFSLLWALALSLWPPFALRRQVVLTPHLRTLRRHGMFGLCLIAMTMLWGAFVAGLDAGMIYNEFPKMGGQWIPGELLFMKPWWLNFLHNESAVQWLHRVLGSLTFFTLFTLALCCGWSSVPQIKKIGALLGLLITMQFALGVATLLSHVAVPLAAAHQAGAVLNLMTLLALLLLLRPEVKT